MKLRKINVQFFMDVVPRYTRVDWYTKRGLVHDVRHVMHHANIHCRAAANFSLFEAITLQRNSMLHVHMIHTNVQYIIGLELHMI